MTQSRGASERFVKERKEGAHSQSGWTRMERERDDRQTYRKDKVRHTTGLNRH